MANLDPEPEFFEILNNLPNCVFTTADFVEQYKIKFPQQWEILEKRYGMGGKGAGQHYTIFSRIAKWLSRESNGLSKAPGFVPAADWWGNSVIQSWRKGPKNQGDIDSPSLDEEYREGSLRLKIHLARERHNGLAKRKKAAFIANNGRLFCEVCKLIPSVDLPSSFGDAVIEVHHATTLISQMKEGHHTKLGDLQCLCANCHRIAHAEIRNLSGALK